MKASVAKLKNAGASGLLLLLIAVCVVSMAGVAAFYHLALGRVARTAAASSTAVQEQLRSSHALIESLSLAQNALQTLLREKDPDVLERLVTDLDTRQADLSARITALGAARAPAVRAQFDAWNAACKQIVETFLRGENAEANSALVNRLMPLSERVLTEVRGVNQASEGEAIARGAAMQADIIRTRDRAMIWVAVAAAAIVAGGLMLRRHVGRGAGAVAEALGRLTSLRAANELLEERVRERTAQIERGNAQMAAIHQTSLDCVMVVDAYWRIIEFNPSAQRAFACAAADAISRPIAQFIVPPRWADAGAFLTSESGTVMGRQIEVTARRPDGSTFAAEMAITAARIDGPPVYIASLRDISERKRAEAERDELNNRLLAASRQAGMAEVATGVLHNVGNVLNSVNVSATVVSNKLRQSEVASLAKVGEMIVLHKDDLPAFLSGDERGKLVPGFIVELAQCLGEEQVAMLAELSNLARGIEHIKQTVSAQQSLAKKGSVLTPTEPAQLMESALAMQGGALHRHDIEVVRQFDNIQAVPLDAHKVLQILINLIGNAKHAVKEGTGTTRRITLVIQRVHGSPEPVLRFRVIDTGIGITPENLTRIFSHGFTTKSEGHGFGLHSAANAAREMGGSLTAASDGPNAGATFTLELPIQATASTPQTQLQGKR